MRNDRRRPAPPRRWPAGLVRLTAAAALVAGFAQAAPAGAITTSHRVRIPSDMSTVEVGPDGTTRGIVRRPEPARISLVRSTLGRDGMPGPGTVLLSSPRKPPRSVATAITPRGAVAAYERPAHDSRLRSIEVVSLTLGRRPTAPQRISPAWGKASEPELMTGGGAAAVLFTQRRPHGRPQLMWAYRPAHAARFLPARTLSDPATYDQSRYVVKLGPNGEGAVLETSIFPEGEPPPFRVRRLGADGSVDPWITVSDEGFEDGAGALALARDGTIAIAFAADRRIDGRGESALVSTSLPPDTSVPTPAQHLETVPVCADCSTDLPDYSLELAIGADGQAAIATTPDDSNKIKLFTGPASRLRLTGDFDAPGIDIRRAITVTRDGGVTAAWTPVNGFDASSMVATHQPPGGTFSRPTVVGRSAYKGDYTPVVPSSLTPVHRRDAVLRYVDSSGDRSSSHLVTLTP